MPSRRRPRWRSWLTSFDHLFETLNDEERRIVALKLDGCTNDEVAAKLNCSERTVRRLMKQLQARLETQLDTIDGSVE
jgi:RNA polymerase sigma factor (sigma-70 family)